MRRSRKPWLPSEQHSTCQRRFIRSPPANCRLLVDFLAGRLRRARQLRCARLALTRLSIAWPRSPSQNATTLATGVRQSPNPKAPLLMPTRSTLVVLGMMTRCPASSQSSGRTRPALPFQSLSL